MSSYIINESKDGVIQFTINRAEKRNAVNYEVMEGLQKAIQLANKPESKLLVITGAGNEAFCSGGDLSVFHSLRTEEQAYGMLSKMAGILYDLMMLKTPSVALMNGTAVGGGCELATACDFRIARKGIKAGFIQGKLVITTGWGGGSFLFEKIAYPNALKMLTEAKTYPVDELSQLGFINYIFEGEPEEGLANFIKNMLAIDGDVHKAYKEMATRKWEGQNLRGRIEEEVRRCSVLWENEKHHKQVDLFINRK
ncbi:enoyl-CoA hydratase/isomerase family protein [Bacillus sp. 31A1R]|uniref:Ethylmalonyl-CoA decarboxylase n=1 Tax=Robertmurraya mangrovi TaxID=3098077 RepID=A0ABU5IU75_9BACI|nr:enoyl-CoA hydratase/isomerase family protein [Bacillus sp. 31A1R]MDZ5470683.1 enoyl-CoA hydratase/isomerase family protein [Bacillus sp. 31A1R]